MAAKADPKADWLTTGSGAETEFKTKDGTTLYAKEWKVTTNEPPVASMVFLHGYSDHCNAYFDFFPALAAKGIEVYAYDQRGWGRTCGSNKKVWGHSGPTATSVADVDEVVGARLAECAKSTPAIPLFLMGHSAGGALCLTYASSPSTAANRAKLHGYLTESPFIRIAKHEAPNPLVFAIGKGASHIMPNMQMKNSLDVTVLARDQEIGKVVGKDPLCHDTGTLKGISDMFARGERLQKAEVIGKGGEFDKSKPVWVGHGTDDKVTDFDASKAFVDALHVDDKTFKAYQGSYHKIHCDSKETADEFATDIANWIKERINKPTATEAAEPAPQANL